MIVYFADRRLSILGLASTELDTVAYISDDQTVTDVNTGTTTLSLVIEYDDAGRKSAESMANAGNYILRHDDSRDKDEFFTIIDFEEDVDGHKISIYAEDGGLDLINDVAGPFYAESAHTMLWYMERWLVGTGFEIRADASIDSEKTLLLGWDNTSTVTNRLVSIANAFEAEIDFGFEIEELTLTHKYVNVYKKRGKDVGSKLRVGKELSNFRIKKSVANLATALDVVGGSDDSEVDMTGVGAILIGNDYAFGDGQSGNGWVDSFYQQTECMGYAIRQQGGDFAAKGGANSTYPNKNYAECLQTFMSTSGSQNKTYSQSGSREYKITLDLSWSIPTNDNPISVNYTFKLHSGAWNFTNFYMGYDVTIGGTQMSHLSRSDSSYVSISKNSSMVICSGSGTVPQSDGNISVSAMIDMNPYAANGQAVGPDSMQIKDSFKVVKANTDEEKRAIKYIIVGGGVNDISSTKNTGGASAIKTGIDNFINVAHTTFPYAKIYIVPLFGTIEGNIADQSKTPKTTITKNSFTETQWLTYTTLGHTETWSGTSGSRNGATTGDIFYVKGKSTDGGWTHTAIYSTTNTSGNLAGTCVGHMVDGLDTLKETWVGYARTKGAYTCEKSVNWFTGDDSVRPEEGSTLLLTTGGYQYAGRYIQKLVGGWDGDVDSDDYGYMSAKSVTLEGVAYDDGDFYVDGTLLKSREAVSKWTRFVNNETAYTDSYHIVRQFNYNTSNQDELLTQAIAELKRLREAEVTYEADINYLPEDIAIGDTVDIVDEFGELFLSTRILQIEHSDTREEDRITFGEFTVKSSGISQMVYDLAEKFKEESSKQVFHTWTVYADDNVGTNISLSRLPSSKYLGIATYRVSPDVDMSDPSIFKWTVLDDADEISISISSSNGTYFTTSTVNTVLTAFVFVNGVMQTPEQIAQYGLIHWYKDGSLVMNGNIPYEGSTLTILESDLVDKGVYEARLEG